MDGDLLNMTSEDLVAAGAAVCYHCNKVRLKCVTMRGNQVCPACAWMRRSPAPTPPDFTYQYVKPIDLDPPMRCG